ncbi:MAG: GNAT family N-acetyltransferase [Syntrophaceae bacterium]|nr:GNAT family N-acetyltransferase [Syntrophaceae bacterium]
MDELERAQEQWNDVYNDSGMKSPVMSYEYVKHWYECFSKPKDIRVFRVMDADKSIGFLPMVVRSKNGVRILTNQTNDHCFYGEVLVRQGYEKIFRKKLLDEILDDNGWDVLHHMFGYSFSAIYPLFTESLLAEGNRRWTIKVQPTYSIVLDKTFDEYFQNDLSSSMRKSLKLSKSRLKKAGPHNYLHYERNQAIAMWQELLRIEDSGWKGKNGSSILKTVPEYRRFYDGLIRILALSGDLHLYFLELDKKNIAAVFGYTSGDVFQYLKIGYDEEYSALSPSNMLFMHLVKDIQENYRQIKRIHLFPYDDTGYKKRYANEEQQFAEIVIYNNTIGGRYLYALDRIKEKISKHPRLAQKIKRIMSAMK